MKKEFTGPRSRKDWETLMYCIDAWTEATYIQYGTVCIFQALYTYTSAAMTYHRQRPWPLSQHRPSLATQALSLAREGQLQDIVTPPSTSILNLSINLKKPAHQDQPEECDCLLNEHCPLATILGDSRCLTFITLARLMPYKFWRRVVW